MIKILFTGGGGAGNEAIHRLLGNRYFLHFGDADIDAIDPGIPEGQRHKLPWATDPHFIEKINEICQRLDIDLLVPGVDEELSILADNINIFQSTKLFLPDGRYIRTMLDKLYMVNALAEKKIPVPLSHTLAEGFDGIRFPCILKPRTGRGSRDVSILHSEEEAQAKRDKWASVAENFLVQEKIEGNEYTVQMVANRYGDLKAVVPVKVHIKKGITLRAETEARAEVISACQLVHQLLPTSGCYNIQLIMTAGGEVFPFEINPRISTTFCLVIAAGIDPIAAFFDETVSNCLIPFTSGLGLQRHWNNHFSRATK